MHGTYHALSLILLNVLLRLTRRLLRELLLDVHPVGLLLLLLIHLLLINLLTLLGILKRLNGLRSIHLTLLDELLLLLLLLLVITRPLDILLRLLLGHGTLSVSCVGRLLHVLNVSVGCISRPLLLLKTLLLLLDTSRAVIRLDTALNLLLLGP